MFNRDNFTCNKCGKKSEGDIEAHHIKTVSSIVKENYIQDLLSIINCKELWNIDNGITLCKSCHSSEHKEHRRAQKWDS